MALFRVVGGGWTGGCKQLLSNLCCAKKNSKKNISPPNITKAKIKY